MVWYTYLLNYIPAYLLFIIRRVILAKTIDMYMKKNCLERQLHVFAHCYETLNY